jgi:hypothetical protein
MTDTELMQSIKAKYGALLASLAPTSHVPVSFLAALIANESGGDPNAKRFEGGVLASLWQVLLGRKPNYGSIGGQDLRTFLIPAGAIGTISPSNAVETVFGIVQRLDSIATSWGITQIMGYEILDLGLGLNPAAGITALQDPNTNLATTLRMLAQFASRNGLDLGTNFSELFDCWNTGRPHARTFDPQYIPRGLARKTIYETLG